MNKPQEPAHAATALDAPLAPLTEQALEWLVHLHSGKETEADWAAYEDWRSASPAHEHAAEHAERLWAGVGSALNRSKPNRTRRAAIISAGLLLLAAAGFSSGLFGTPGAYFPDLHTAVGERRSLTLVDGTQLDMDAATSLNVMFSGESRRLVLFSGRIYVAVAPDPARPFVVEAAGGSTRALGTAFEVSRDNEAISVVVTQHVVRVSYPDDANSPHVDVEAGNETHYEPKAGLAAPRAVDTQSLTAWRRGLLAFQDRPLGEVVSQIERYRHGRVVIVDAELARLPVSGIFESSDTDALLDALTTALPVQITRLPWLTFIRRDADRPLEPFAPRQ